MNKPVLVVMAAGMGSRYGGLKQLDPVDEYGHLIIDYALFDARRAGFETVIFIIKEELEIRHNRNVVRKLTDTGIILICGEDGCLITGFMGTMAQVGTFYKGQDIPRTMKQRVRKNNEKYAFLLKM